MKSIFLMLSVICLTAFGAYAQKYPVNATQLSELPVIYLPPALTVHFLSPEPIQYVDISTKAISGDLPVKNVLRIKSIGDSVKDAVITIVGEKFIAQYHVICSAAGTLRTNIEINPADTRPMDFPGVALSQPELKNYALRLVCKKPDKHLEHAKAYGIKVNLNHIYTLGDYIFLDIGFENETNLKYDIDELRFKIEDKKVNKASNIQEIRIEPVFTLFDLPSFKKYYRNIFVFKKFTFPGNKQLKIDLSEKQISGRTISLKIPYQDVLDADQIYVK